MPARVREACRAWLHKSPSAETRSNYARDLAQFLTFLGADPDALVRVTPAHVAAWGDALLRPGIRASR